MSLLYTLGCRIPIGNPKFVHNSIFSLFLKNLQFERTLALISHLKKYLITFMLNWMNHDQIKDRVSES